MDYALTRSRHTNMGRSADVGEIAYRRLLNHLGHTLRSKAPLPNRRGHREDRQVHRDDDESDRDAEKHHHHRLE